jgi:hypothetical protein
MAGNAAEGKETKPGPKGCKNGEVLSSPFIPEAASHNQQQTTLQQELLTDQFLPSVAI